MSAQISVVVAYYRDPQRCSAALHSLELLSGTAKALDAAILRARGPGRRLEIVEEANFHRERGPGLSIEAVFPEHVLDLSPVGQSTSDATDYFHDQGLDVNLLKEVGENLPPGGAALIMFIEESWLTELTGMLRGYSDIERFLMRPDGSPLSSSHIDDDTGEGGPDDS